jgi:hypothetical protein
MGRRIAGLIKRIGSAKQVAEVRETSGSAGQWTAVEASYFPANDGAHDGAQWPGGPLGKHLSYLIEEITLIFIRFGLEIG